MELLAGGVSLGASSTCSAEVSLRCLVVCSAGVVALTTSVVEVDKDASDDFSVGGGTMNGDGLPGTVTTSLT